MSDEHSDYGDIRLLVKTHKEGYKCIVEIEKMVVTWEPNNSSEQTITEEP